MKFPLIINVLFPLLRLAHFISFFILFIYFRNYIKSAAHEYVHRHHHCKSGIFLCSLSWFLHSSDMRKSTGKMQNPLPDSVGRCSERQQQQHEKNCIQKKLSKFSSWGIRREWKSELVDVRESRNYTQRTEQANDRTNEKLNAKIM